MYLIQERGPTSFVFKLKHEVDPNLPVEEQHIQEKKSIKIRVDIGNLVCCFHCRTKGQHCEHSLYTLLKIFKVSENDGLLKVVKFSDR